MYLQGERVRLRAIEESDAEAFWLMRNDMDTGYFASMQAPMPSSLKSTEEIIRKVSGARNIKDAFVFVIEDENKEFIGTINGAFVDLKNRHFMLGITLNSKSIRGKGYGTEAIKLFIDFAFRELNMNKVWLGTFSFNPGAIRCYEKCGFKKEAVAKNRIYRDGAFHDEITMSILRDEYFGG